MAYLSSEAEPVEPLAWSLATDPPPGKFAAVFVSTTETDTERVAKSLSPYRASFKYAVGIAGGGWGKLNPKRWLVVPASCVPSRRQFHESGEVIYSLWTAGPKAVLYLDRQGTNIHQSMFADTTRAKTDGWLSDSTEQPEAHFTQSHSRLLVLGKPGPWPKGVTICHTN